MVPPDHPLTITSTSSGTIYYTLDGSDPREAVTGNALGIPYGGPASLTRTTVVKARLRNAANEWSALTEARFIVGTRAGPGNLVISKIHFHPALPEEPEYVELLNISQGPIDLTGLTFSTGIDYTFPDGTVLEAGQRLVVTGQQFSGKLDNSGETLALSTEAGADLFRFRYDDDTPWPGGSDGGGKAMVLIAPHRNPDPADPANWRASAQMGGEPGTDDAVLFTGDPTADLDRDGLSALLEYALGSSDAAPSLQGLPVAGREVFPTPSGPAEFLTITTSHGPATDSAAFTGEFSTPLRGWGLGILVRRRSDGLETWRAPVPMTGERQFLRMKATLR